MKYNIVIVAIISILFFGCLNQPVNRDSSVPLTLKKTVDVNLYQGKWYEVARFPNAFQRNCKDSTAVYEKVNKEKIKVINSCTNIKTNKKKQTVGKARKVSDSTEAKFQVRFFSLQPWADYWVLDRGNNYEWSIVGEPEGKFLWVLARKSKLSELVMNEILAKLENLGYNTEALLFNDELQ